MTTENEWIELPTLQDVAKAQADGREIERLEVNRRWKPWRGTSWSSLWKFRARPAQPKTKKVKMLCWTDGEDLYWKPECHPVMHWQRFPAGDIEGEVTL